MMTNRSDDGVSNFCNFLHAASKFVQLAGATVAVKPEVALVAALGANDDTELEAVAGATEAGAAAKATGTFCAVIRAGVVEDAALLFLMLALAGAAACGTFGATLAAGRSTFWLAGTTVLTAPPIGAAVAALSKASAGLVLHTPRNIGAALYGQNRGAAQASVW